MTDLRTRLIELRQLEESVKAEIMNYFNTFDKR